MWCLSLSKYLPVLYSPFLWCCEKVWESASVMTHIQKWVNLWSAGWQVTSAPLMNNRLPRWVCVHCRALHITLTSFPTAGPWLTLPWGKDKWGWGAEIVIRCSLQALLNQRPTQWIIRFVQCLPVHTELLRVIPFPQARKKLTNLNHTVGTQSSCTPNSELVFSVSDFFFSFFPSIHPSSLPSFTHPSHSPSFLSFFPFFQGHARVHQWKRIQYIIAETYTNMLIYISYPKIHFQNLNTLLKNGN